MRHWWMAAGLVLMGMWQAPLARTSDGDSLAALESHLAGDYDNDEQVLQARKRGQLGVPHVIEHLRLLDRARGGNLWLWQLQTTEQSNAARAMWLYRFSSDGRRITATPYRPLDAEAIEKELADPKFSFRFVADRWAELAPCTLKGEMKDGLFSASVDSGTCSALVPGLGAAAALLPFRVSTDGDLLRAATFADQARGGDATLDARRVHWFAGWSAINGGGPNFKPENQDWHTHNDLRVSSGGGRVPLRWRDGAPSGYSLQLERRTYPERKLNVLQLNVIEDASGRTVYYVWASPESEVIGMNFGWLQVGLKLEAP